MLRSDHYTLPRARPPISRGTIPARGKGYLEASIMLQRRKRAHETFTRLYLGDTSSQLLGQGTNMRLLQHACMIARDLVYFQPTGHHTTPPALRVFFNSYPLIFRAEENRPPRIQLWHILAESLVKGLCKSLWVEVTARV